MARRSICCGPAVALPRLTDIHVSPLAGSEWEQPGVENSDSVVIRRTVIKILTKEVTNTMRALSPWSPRRELSTLQQEFDGLFSRFFGNDAGLWSRPLETSIVPAIESFVRDDALVVRADLPGIDPKDVEVAVEGNHLTLKGERKSVRENGDTERAYREVSYGRFERTVRLPAGVDPDSIKASYRDGVLEVTMKAPTHLTSRKVQIAVH
jgi:HSP20 family protein